MPDPTIPALDIAAASPLQHDAEVLLQRISDAYILLDREYRFLYANPPALRDMRKTMDELRGRVHWDVFPASRDITAGRRYRAAAETRLPQHFTQHYHYEGYDIHMEMSAYPTDAGGVAVFWRDVTDRVRAEERLRESEMLAHDRFAELDQVYRYAPVGLFTVDRALRFTRVNERLAEINGRTIDEHIGRTVREVVPDIVDNVELLFRRVLDHGDAIVDLDIIGETPARPGVTRHFLGKYHPLRAADDTIVGLIGVVLDVSRFREAEAKLRASEERASLLLRDAPVPMWLYDRDTLRFLEVNAEAVRIYGYTADEFLSLTLRDIRPTEELAALDRMLAEPTGAGVRQSLARHRTRDGRIRDVEVWTQSVDYRGRAVRIAMVIDVSERRRALEALTASEERYALAARATRNAIRDWELATELVTWSTGLADIFGWPAEATEPTLAWWLARVHDDDRPRVASGLHRVVDAGSRAIEWQESYRFRRADGRWADVLDRGIIARDANGEAVRMICALEDVTAQRELEERLRQSQKMEAIGQLAGGIAHDFNNLLTVITGNLDFISHDLPDGHPVRPDLEEIATAADRARTLVRQLLTFSRKQPVRTTLLSVGDVVQGMERLLRRVIGEEITFEVLIDDRAPRVRIDRGQLEQVVMNLVVNARYAMLTPLHGHPGTGGSLSIEVTSVDGSVLLRVRDTGHGMDEQTMTHLYEPFFTTKEVGTGTGLGLATVHGIVRQAGGDIAVTSAPGRGSTFEVRLPAAHDGPTDAEAVAPDAPSTLVGTTVLLVEDEAPVRLIVRRILEHRGAQVLEARHGRDALELWATQRGRIDLVVTDLRMPELGGRELLALLRRDNPRLRAVLLSGYAEDATAQPLASSERFVEKPFSSDTLLAALHALLTERPGAP